MASRYQSDYRYAKKNYNNYDSNDIIGIESIIEDINEPALRVPDNVNSSEELGAAVLFEDATNNQGSEVNADSCTETDDDRNGHSVYLEPEGLPVPLSDEERQEVSEQPESGDGKDTIKERLATFCVKYNTRVPMEAMREVIDMVRVFRPDIPKDPRVLKNTLRQVNVQENFANGQFVYQGAKPGLTKYLNTNATDDQTLDVTFNIDGLPPFRSKNLSFWPILCMVNECRPFIVALWYGSGKPKPLDSYLRPFITEMKELLRDGLSFDNKHYVIRIRAFICDAPARAWIKCIKGHTGYSSCERCEVRGQKGQGSIIFPELHATKRTDESFKEQTDANHHKDKSPLLELGIGLVTKFPLDYMHLICLGVMRKLLINWKMGPRQSKISQSAQDVISACLKKIVPHVPSEFNRRPRGLDELSMWKATEYRFFLLYAGFVVLKGVIRKEQWKMFLHLSLAMHVLLCATKCTVDRLVDDAEQMLVNFVKMAIYHYGEDLISYNMHGIIHIADDVRNFKCPLDKLSAFPFENYLGQMKRMVRSPTNVIQQVIKRTEETDGVQSQKAMRQERGFSSKLRDSTYLLKRGGLIVIDELEEDVTGNTIVHGRKIHPKDLKSFFHDPYDSRMFDIYYTPSLLRCIQVSLHPKDIGCKAIMMPSSEDSSESYVIVKLLNMVI